ncbi:MAG TPA: guanylate kinase [Dehalococcoidia bacterium]|nr:guanylate kinase [Dehalococcoidia bacterium]
MPATPLLVVITGPSGVGKDTVLEALRRTEGRPYGFPVNATTRPPRPGETDGIDYHFLSTAEFARRLAAGDFLEHASVYGQEKGVLKAPVRTLLQQGDDVILRTDIQGARYIKSIVPAAVTIFIAPPSFTEMERRLIARGGDSPEQVKRRLQTAREEIAAAPEFDYTVINEDVSRCVAEIESIIEHERARPGRTPTVIG